MLEYATRHPYIRERLCAEAQPLLKSRLTKAGVRVWQGQERFLGDGDQGDGDGGDEEGADQSGCPKPDAGFVLSVK